MYYSKEFKEKVNKLMNDSKVAEMLEKGDLIVGRYLDEYSQERISAKEVLKAIENNDLESLKAKAEGIQAYTDLYREWCDMYDANYKENE